MSFDQRLQDISSVTLAQVSQQVNYRHFDLVVEYGINIYVPPVYHPENLLLGILASVCKYAICEFADKWKTSNSPKHNASL